MVSRKKVSYVIIVHRYQYHELLETTVYVIMSSATVG